MPRSKKVKKKNGSGDKKVESMFLTPEEAAKLLNVSLQWIYRRTYSTTDKTPIPHYKLDGKLRLIESELREWALAMRVQG